MILGASSLPEPTKKEDVVVWYPWTINNKYYTANVSLCVVPSPFSMNAGVAQSTQAFIVYFDSKAVSESTVRLSFRISGASHPLNLSTLQKDGLTAVTPWIALVEEMAPEVLVLVCDQVCENGECCHQRPTLSTSDND